MKKLTYALVALGLLAYPAAAQDYPNKPVKILVGFAPGGGTDITARIIGKKLSENLGQQFVIENRAGAGGVVAHELAAQAAPDGYTILLGNVGAFTVSPHMQKVGYDTERDFAPISMGVIFANVLVVHADVKARTLAEYLAIGKREGMPYGTSGVGGAGHLAGELLKKVSGGPAMTDLLGKQVASVFAALPSALPHIQNGTIFAIAVSSSKRARDLPNVPTVAESGFPGYEATNWYAFVAPAKTPQPIIAKLNAELGKAMGAADTVAELAKHGLEPAHSTPDQLAAYMRRESDTWSKIVKEVGIKPE
jgi:tripartite-type tricarboxylate transporter receptor subunit TctC